tara:strand:- start:218 stop:844 length:627 start_codon:yes stop_codon:yes gene_type:complete
MVKSYQKMVNYINKEIFQSDMKAEEKIYLAFFELKQPRIYYNQIKEHTKLSHSSLQNALKKLKDVFEEEKTKSNTFYKINDKKFFGLKFSEIAINKFKHLNPNIKTPLNNFLKKIPGQIYTIVLFGSASRKEETKRSDIDILIVSDKKVNLSKNKKEAEITSKHPISLFQVTFDQFKKNKDDVVIQVRKTGFPIYKEQNFYEVILDEY